MSRLRRSQEVRQAMYEIPSFAAGMVTEYIRQADELIVLHLHQSGASQPLHTALELLAMARSETTEWQRTASLIVDYGAANAEVLKERQDERRSVGGPG